MRRKGFKVYDLSELYSGSSSTFSCKDGACKSYSQPLDHIAFGISGFNDGNELLLHIYAQTRLTVFVMGIVAIITIAVTTVPVIIIAP